MSLNKHHAEHTLSHTEGYTDPIGTSGTSALWKDIIEVASPLFEGHCPQVNIDALLCIKASPSQLGSGDVSPNMRYNDDSVKNNEGCVKWVNILTTAKKIYSTTISRDEMIRMYTINDDGTVDVYNKEMEEIPEEKVTLHNFLQHFGMDTERVKVMKEASVDGVTYMEDLLSFILTMEVLFNTVSFTSQWVVPEIINQGDERLTPVEKDDGNVWTPVEGNDYLYFTPSLEGEGINIMKYSGDSTTLYTKLQELLSLEENVTKADLRTMFGWFNVYKRSSDIWINDIDGPITIYMILNAYSHTTLTEDEEKVKAQLEQITTTFFQ